MTTMLRPLRLLRRPEWPLDAWSRRRLVALLVCLSVSGLSVPAARAQWIVNDPINLIQNTATAVQTLEMMHKQFEQILQQKQQIENEINMLRKLADPPWRAIRDNVEQLDAVMRAGEALSYSMDGLLAEFGLTFPGFRAYADWSLETRRQFERTLQTYANVMMSLQQQGRHFRVSQQELERIKAALERAQGQTSAIELMSTIGTFTAEELVLIRQLLAVQANAQTVHSAYLINQEAQRMALQEQIYREMAGYDHPRGRGYSGILAEDGP